MKRCGPKSGSQFPQGSARFPTSRHTPLFFIGYIVSHQRQEKLEEA